MNVYNLPDLSILQVCAYMEKIGNLGTRFPANNKICSKLYPKSDKLSPKTDNLSLKHDELTTKSDNCLPKLINCLSNMINCLPNLTNCLPKLCLSNLTFPGSQHILKLFHVCIYPCINVLFIPAKKMFI